MSKPGGKDGKGSGSRGLTTRVRTARGRKASSTRWLQRQLNDPYVAEAQRLGYRSRAAFKLIELDERCGLLKPGLRVLDLGAAPGGWTQVAVAQDCTVVGLDLLPMDSIPGVTLLQGDINDDAVLAAVEAALGGPVDLVLSDMAANTTGHARTDHLRTAALADLALDTALRLLAPGGSFVAKVFQGGSEKAMRDVLNRSFAKVRHMKPPASRPGSPELYVVAQDFRPA